MIEYTVGDTGPNLIGHINNSLVGVTGIVINYWKPDGTPGTGSAAALGDPADGDWESDIVPDQAGMWLVTSKVTFSNAESQTYGPSAVFVRSALV